MNDREFLELCRQSISDQLDLSLAARRLMGFNREDTAEAYIAVVRARWTAVETLITREISQSLARENNVDDRTVMMKALSIAVTALKDAETQFMFYRGQHAQKGTPDGDRKADVNQTFADQMARAIHDVQMHVGEVSLAG